MKAADGQWTQSWQRRRRRVWKHDQAHSTIHSLYGRKYGFGLDLKTVSPLLSGYNGPPRVVCKDNKEGSVRVCVRRVCLWLWASNIVLRHRKEEAHSGVWALCSGAVIQSQTHWAKPSTGKLLIPQQPSQGLRESQTDTSCYSFHRSPLFWLALRW